MKKPILLASFLFATVLSAQVEEADIAKYPASLEAVPRELRYPIGAPVSVDRDGNFTVGEQIRHLIGVQTCKTYDNRDCSPTPGYPAELKWIYEKLLDLDTAQRIGFDSIAPFTSNHFVNRFVPEHERGKRSPDLLRCMRDWADCGLPLFVDFTSVPWAKGCFNSNDPELAKHRSPDALNAFHKSTINHWVPYNVFHPDAHKLYKAYWEDGVGEYAGKSPILAYELFNEPGYDDPSPYNRRLFAKHLKEKYRTFETMNRVWKSEYWSFDAAAAFQRKTENAGLAVDWGKFMETGFVDLCKFGREVIRAKVPGARTSVQPLGGGLYRQLTRSNINPYEINRHMDAISLPTGGGITGFTTEAETERTLDAPANSPGLGEGLLQRHYFRAIADGKPLLNGELYINGGDAALKKAIWLDLLRGSNASYVFEWTKRAWDWKPRNEEGGRKCADREPYQVLNPYNRVPLYEIMSVKREIFRFGSYFMPRDRNVERKLAVLVSYPSERRAEAVANPARDEVSAYVCGLEFSHIPIDAILEEQLDGKRENRYRAILAVGVRNIYPETAKRLTDFVNAGGHLILAREFMTEDEYGHPVDWNNLLDFQTGANVNAVTMGITPKLGNPSLLPGKIRGRATRFVTAAPGWEILAAAGGKPVMIRRSAGKGSVTVLTPELQDYPAAALLLPHLEAAGVKPAASIRRAEEGDLAGNIELHTARRGDITLYFLMNHSVRPKFIRFSTPEKASVFDLLNNRKPAMEQGEAPLFLPGKGYLILGSGPEAELTKEFGTFTESAADDPAEAFSAAREVYAKAEEEAARGVFRFTPDPAQTRTIDLRNHCNRGFFDSVADDGQGGWTDQGHQNSLTGVPWGVTTLLGVPCDLIRFDMNNERTCIVLASKSQKGALPEAVRDIPVGGKVARLYFFHTAAWVSNNTKALTYRMRYASGKTVDADAVCGVNIDNWWLTGSVSKFIAFRNRENRGFYCMEWVNPTPEDDVVSLDILSPNSNVVPIVIGITAENYMKRETVSWTRLASTSWGGVAVRNTGAETEGSISEATEEWAGIDVRPADKSSLKLTPEQWKKGKLVFFVNGGRDKFGNAKGDQLLKVSLRNIREGKFFSTETVNLAPHLLPLRKIDSDPESFQKAEIPLVLFKGGNKINYSISSVALQFLGTGKDSGVILKDFTFVLPEAP